MIRNVDAWEANATCTFVKPFNRRTVQKQGHIPRPYLKDSLTRGHGAPRRQGALASRLYRTTAVERVKLGIGPNSLCRWCYYKGVLTLRQADAIGAPRCAAGTLRPLSTIPSTIQRLWWQHYMLRSISTRRRA